MARTKRATGRRAGRTIIVLLAVLLGSTACDLPAQDGIVEFPNMMPAMNARADASTDPGIAVSYTKSLAGSVIVDIMDSDGDVVSTSRTASSRTDLPSGTYQVQVVEEGPVSSTGTGAQSSAVAVRSSRFTHTGGSITTVTCTATNCTIG